MYAPLLSVLACPRDGSSPFRVEDQTTDPDGEILTGTLVCPSCGTRYRIEEGIPDLCELTGSSGEVATKADEIRARAAEADGPYAAQFHPYDTATELSAFLAHLQPQRSDRILELGAGDGRLTLPILARSAEVVAADFSMAFLRRLRQLAGRPRNLHLIRADATRLPLLREASFDRAFSAQVFEHLPSAGARHDFCEGARTRLRPDGRFVMTTYNYNWIQRRTGEPKEGRHDLGIYYYRYDAAELEADLRAHFQVDAVLGIRNRIIPQRLLEPLGALAVRIDGLIARSSLSRATGRLLLASCRPLPIQC